MRAYLISFCTRVYDSDSFVLTCRSYHRGAIRNSTLRICLQKEMTPFSASATSPTGEVHEYDVDFIFGAVEETEHRREKLDRLCDDLIDGGTYPEIISLQLGFTAVRKKCTL